MPENMLAPDVSSYADPGLNKLLAAASNDPNAALQTASGALTLAQQGLNLQRGGVQLSQQQFDLAKAKLDHQNQLFGSLVNDPSPDNFAGRLGDAVSAGTIDSETAKRVALQVAGLGGDPQKLRGWALDHLNVNASHGQALEQAFGTPGLVNTGGALVPTLTRTGANAGMQVAGGAPIATTLSPGEKTGRVGFVDPNTGAGQSTSVGQLYDARGNPRGAAYGVDAFGAVARGAPPGGPAGSQGGPMPSPPPQAPAMPSAAPQAAGQGQGQGAAPGPVSDSDYAAALRVVGTARTRNPNNFTPEQRQAIQIAQGMVTRYQQQQNTPQGGAAPQAGQPAAPPPSGMRAPPAPLQPNADGMAQRPGSDSSHMVRVAPPAGQGAPSAPASPAGPGGALTTSLSPGQSASLKAGSDTYAALQSDVSNPNGSPGRMFNLSQALDATRNTSTGRGTAFRQEMVGYLDALPGGLGKLFPGVDPNSLTNYDLATKYTNAIAMQASGASRSDQAQALASSANANTGGMTQEAAQHVILNQIGQEGQKQAVVAAFNASGQDAGNFNKFAQQWGQGVDPRAFALGAMTPPERAALFSSLQGPQRAGFLASVRKGLAAGVLKPSDLQGAAGDAR